VLQHLPSFFMVWCDDTRDNSERKGKTVFPMSYSVSTTFAPELKPVVHFATLENSESTSITKKSTVTDFPLVMKYVNYRLFYISKVLVQQE